jgi:hypothetical protein
MLRIIALAASAAVLAAAPARAGSIHVSTAGKSPDEVTAQVVKAAAQLCETANDGFTFSTQIQEACVSATVRSALAQSRNMAAAKVASR